MIKCRKKWENTPIIWVFWAAVTFERPIDLPESEFGSEKAVTRNAVRPVSREMDYTPAKRHYTPAQLVAPLGAFLNINWTFSAKMLHFFCTFLVFFFWFFCCCVNFVNTGRATRKPGFCLKSSKILGIYKKSHEKSKNLWFFLRKRAS
jgi:hypothetical protein